MRERGGREVQGSFKLLHPLVRRLLVERGMYKPTPPQDQAIPVILEGHNTLLVSPTGSGKTEAAMLPVFSMLINEGKTAPGVKALYITPLRALNRDLIFRLQWWASNLDVRIGVRHSDTPPSERRAQSRSPPDLLVTTPETMQILLVADAMRRHLRSVRWVVVDEVHELAEDKRGSQLAVILERLTRLAGEFQRIGLSATVGSPDELARFLVGRSRGCRVVVSQPPKPFEIKVVYPGVGDEDYEVFKSLGVHPVAAARLRVLAELVSSHRSTLIFTNTRSEAEILVNRLRTYKPELGLGIHHSSLSQESRVDSESRLKSGELKAVVCTSSLELGIDVGRLDLVVQYGSPHQVMRLVQRVGRSGHSLERVSRGVVIALDEDDALEAMVIAKRAVSGRLEKPLVPRGPYDVLMQQLSGVLLEEGVARLDSFLDVLARTLTYEGVTLYDLERVAEFMSSLFPPIARYSRSTRTLHPPFSRKRLYEYHYDTLTMIPDEPKYIVVNEAGEPIGLLDEEFVAGYLTIGSKFVLAGRVWVVKQIVEDRVVVSESEDPVGAIPSWVGEEIPVPEEVALEVGSVRRRMAEAGGREDAASLLSKEYGVDLGDALRVVDHVVKQRERGLPVPSDVVVTVEKWGEYVIVHTHRGLKANRALAKLIGKLVSERLGLNVSVYQDPYRVVVRCEGLEPGHVVEALNDLTRMDVYEAIKDSFLDTWMFLRRLVQAARKMGVVKSDTRLTGSDVRKLVDVLRDTVVYEEAWRTLFEEDVDARAVHKLLSEIKSGRVKVVNLGVLEEPSPTARIGLEKAAIKGEVVDKARLRRLVIASARARVRWHVGLALCLDCLDYVNKVRLSEMLDPRCPVCGSRRLALFNEGEEEGVRLLVEELLEGGPTLKTSKSLYSHALRSSLLVEKYGFYGVIAHAFRLPLSKAEKVISSRMGGGLDDVLYALMEEERRHLLLSARHSRA